MPGISPLSKPIKKAEKISKPRLVESPPKSVDCYEKFPIFILVQFDSLTLRFYLLPEFDILTMDFQNTDSNPLATIDMVCGGLFEGQNCGIVQVTEDQFLTMKENERCFKWIHTLAGVSFDHVQLGQYIKDEDEARISSEDQILAKIQESTVFSAKKVIDSIRA